MSSLREGDTIQELSGSARFGSTYTIIGMIQRRLAWPQDKDDMQICEAFHIFRLWDSVGERESGMFRENSIETCILSRVKPITSPGWMHETSARAWCTGKTQRDRVERDVGGGDRDGEHMLNIWLIHVNVWQKPLQYCKVISLQLIKINEKKKRIIRYTTF